MRVEVREARVGRAVLPPTTAHAEVGEVSFGRDDPIVPAEVLEADVQRLATALARVGVTCHDVPLLALADGTLAGRDRQKRTKGALPRSLAASYHIYLLVIARRLAAAAFWCIAEENDVEHGVAPRTVHQQGELVVHRARTCIPLRNCIADVDLSRSSTAAMNLPRRNHLQVQMGFTGIFDDKDEYRELVMSCWVAAMLWFQTQLHPECCAGHFEILYALMWWTEFQQSVVIDARSCEERKKVETQKSPCKFSARVRNSQSRPECQALNHFFPFSRFQFINIIIALADLLVRQGSLSVLRPTAVRSKLCAAHSFEELIVHH